MPQYQDLYFDKPMLYFKILLKHFWKRLIIDSLKVQNNHTVYALNAKCLNAAICQKVHQRSQVKNRGWARGMWHELAELQLHSGQSLRNYCPGLTHPTQVLLGPCCRRKGCHTSAIRSRENARILTSLTDSCHNYVLLKQLIKLYLFNWSVKKSSKVN